MYQLFLALFLAFACPAQNKNNHNKCQQTGTTVTTLDDTGGDDGHVPPNPPTTPIKNG